jgi:hypothetical protein
MDEIAIHKPYYWTWVRPKTAAGREGFPFNLKTWDSIISVSRVPLFKVKLSGRLSYICKVEPLGISANGRNIQTDQVTQNSPKFIFNVSSWKADSNYQNCSSPYDILVNFTFTPLLKIEISLQICINWRCQSSSSCLNKWSQLLQLTKWLTSSKPRRSFNFNLPL